MNSSLPVHIVNLNNKMLRINSLQCVNKKIHKQKIEVSPPKMRSQENSTSRSNQKKDLNVDLVSVSNHNYMSDNAFKKFQHSVIKPE